MSSESSQLFVDIIAGKDEAAKQLFDQYVTRLIGLAKLHLSKRLQSRVDPEDIVQSAFRSFFRTIKDQDMVLTRSGDFWRYLAAITVNKSKKRVEFELAQKRNPRREIGMTVADVVPSEEPVAEEAAILLDEFTAFLSGLRPRDTQILELRLQGERIETIADQVGASEATVRRVLARAGRELERRLLET